MKRSIVMMVIALSGLICETRAQTTESQPPSLQMGLNGLTFRPGGLDAELIMQIVAEKQEEIKKRAIKNLLLRQVNNAGGTVYVFTDNVLNAIINEKDNAVRTRTILENTVNLAFSMALTEYMRQLHDTDFKSLVNSLTTSTLQPRIISNRFFKTPTAYSRTKSFQLTLDTNTATNRSYLYTLDIVSESIRANKQLNALGLMRISYPGEWSALNQYLNEPDSVKKEQADQYKGLIDNRLTRLLSNVGFIANQMEAGNFSFSSKTTFVLADRIANFNLLAFENILKQTAHNVETLLKSDTTTSGRRFRQTHGEALSQYWVYLQKIKSIQPQDLTLQQLSDILYHLTVDVNPQFERVGELIPGVTELHKNTIELEKLITNGVQWSESTSQNDANLMRLIAKLYQFKKAKTYSDYLNILTDLPDLVGDPQVRSTLNTMLSFIKNYVSIKQDATNHELVEIDVESLLVMLQQYSQNRPRTVQFMFTAGANTAYRSAAIGDTVRNFAFVGEKIGLKLKLKDWHYLRSFNKYQTFYRHASAKRTVTRLQPPHEPTVSNMHLLLYGSGILYNLVKSSNNTNFRQPLLGLGLGLTFMNSLDVNLSANFPQKSGKTFNENFSYPFINVGLDILFSEYLDRLVKKRNIVKVEKKE